MNKVFLSGRLTADPEFKKVKSDRSVCKFGLAETFYQGGEEMTQFHNIVAWDKTAETIRDFFHQGDQIILIGRIRYGSYTGSDGHKVNKTDIVLDEFTFGAKGKAQRGIAETQDEGFTFWD